MKAIRILWPTDLSESDHDALVTAGEIARGWRAEVVALHVISDVGETLYGDKTEGKDQAAWGLWKLGKEKAERRLEEIVRPVLRGVGYRCMTAFGDPTAKILEAIRELHAGLVVMSARRDKSLLEEMLLGSVAYKVVRTAPCSVMLVK